MIGEINLVVSESMLQTKLSLRNLHTTTTMKIKPFISSAILASLLSSAAPGASILFDFGPNNANIQSGWTGITHNSADQNAGTSLVLIGGGTPNISVAYPVSQTMHHRDRGTAQFTLGAADPNVNLLRDMIYFDAMVTTDVFTFTLTGLTPGAEYEVFGYSVDMFGGTTNDNKRTSWTTNGGSVQHTTDSGNEDLTSARFQMANLTADGGGVATISAQYVDGGPSIILFNGFEITQIPEPSAALLGGLGLLALLRRRR